MSTQQEVAIVIGVGASDGLGGALARRFARGGFHVVISGRTQEKLDARVSEIVSAGGTASAFVADTRKPDDIDALFSAAAKLGPIGAVLYNAGNNARLGFLEVSPAHFEQFWRICCFGGMLAGQAALRHMLPNGKGTILYTGASGSLRGRPNFAHFASAKAALRNMAQSMAREFGPQGIHVAHVIIDGAINGEMIRGRFPEMLERIGEDGALDPDAIAETFWAIHAQPKSTWTHETELRPFKENW